MQLLVNGRDRRLLAAFPTGASAFPLALHLGVEAFAVDLQTELARHLFLLIEREAEGVVQLERSGAGEHAALRGFGFIVENTLGHLERVRVPMLFFA